MIALHDAGFNQVQISKQLNISHCCVQNSINKCKHLGTCEDSKRLESSKNLDEQSFQHLKRLVNGDARLSATKTVSNLNAILPKPVTTRIVCTYLKELDFE